MQIDRPHTLYKFNDKPDKSKSKSIHDRLNKPTNKSIDTRCLELQKSAVAKMKQNQVNSESRGVTVPFEQIISPHSNYSVKI